MKNKRRTSSRRVAGPIWLSILTCLISGAALSQVQSGAPPSSVARGPTRTVANSITALPANTPPPIRVLDGKGAHFRSWAIISTNGNSTARSANGQSTTTGQRHLIEMASGMHYWSGTNWSQSHASFEVFGQADADIASISHHK